MSTLFRPSRMIPSAVVLLSAGLLATVAVAEESVGEETTEPAAIPATEPPTCAETPGPDCASSADAARGGSLILEPEASEPTRTTYTGVHGTISHDGGDATDWMAVEIPAPGTLLIEVSWAAAAGRATVLVTGDLGGKIARTVRGLNTTTMRVRTRMDGRYHVRIKAERPGALAAYDVRVVWLGEEGAAPLTAEEKAALYLQDARERAPHNVAAAERRLVRACDLAPESAACAEATALRATLRAPEISEATAAAPAVGSATGD